MASVVVNVLKRRHGGKHGQTDGDSFRDQQSSANSVNNSTRSKLLRHPSIMRVFMPPNLSKEDLAARHIQRAFRGYLIRQQLKGLMAENTISWSALLEALETIARWHLGWTRFFLQIIVATFLIVTVCYQVFSLTPTSYDVNSAIIARLSYSTPNSNSLTTLQVAQPVQFFDFLSALVNEFYSDAGMVNSTYCESALNTFCTLGSSTNDSYWEIILAENCTLFPNQQDIDTDYIDQANQLLGSSYVSQTRKEEKPCATRFVTLDDSLAVNKQRPSRYCVDDVLEATEFITDRCRPSSSFTSLNVTNKQRQCEEMIDNQDEFTFNNISNSFIFPLKIGITQALPLAAVQCKIDRMRALDWLDYRTKQVCVQLGFLNREDSGRMTVYRECFTFTNGGRVIRARTVSSSSLFSDAEIPIALTWTLIALTIVKQVLDFVLAVRQRADRQLFTISNLLSLIPSLMVLVGCVLYLVVVYSMMSLSTDAAASDSLQGFVSILYEASWAIELWVIFTTIISIALLLMLAKTISILDFHPTSAIISGTLRRSSSALGCFAVIYAMVVLCYAFVGMILLGGSRYDFATFGRAVNTLLFVAVGEMQSTQDLIFHFYNDDYYVEVIQGLYFWSYVLLVTILLMNVLLSIIVGAFVDLQEKTEKGTDSKPVVSFYRSLAICVFFYAEAAYVYVIRFGRFMKNLCGRRRKTNPASSPLEPNKDEVQGPFTPWEKLISFPRNHRFRAGAESARIVRQELQKIFKSERTVEWIILWCRARSRMEKFQKFGLHLRGIDPDSTAFKGHTIYLLESIVKKLGPSASGRFERTTVSSNRSLGTFSQPQQLLKAASSNNILSQMSQDLLDEKDLPK